MGQRFSATLTIQGETGLASGPASSIEDRSLTFEVDAELAVGEQVVWRMELPGQGDSVMGRMRIVSAQERRNRSTLYVGTIYEVRPEDQRSFDSWLTALGQGKPALAQSRRDLESVPPARTPSAPPGASPRSVPGPERVTASAPPQRAAASAPPRSAVPSGSSSLSEALERLRSASHTRSDAATARPTPSVVPQVPTASVDRRSPEIGSPRAPSSGAVTQERKREWEPEPTTGGRAAVAAMIMARLRAEPGSTHAAAPAPATSSAPADPEVSYADGLLEVRFRSLDRYRAVYKRDLKALGMQARVSGIGPVGTRLTLRLTLPSGNRIEVPAEVVFDGGGYTAIQLTADAAARSTLATG